MNNPLVPRPTPLPALLGVVLALACALPASGQSAGAPDPGSARALALDAVSREIGRAEPALRAELAAGDIDPQLHLGACDRMQAVLRPGIALRGRIPVSVHCLQGAGWTANITVTARLFGPAYVANRPIPSMGAVDPSGLRVEEVEWTREPMGLAASARDIEGRITLANVAAGQPLPMRTLRLEPAVQQGDPVKVVGQGDGFQISTTGTALASAGPGESVRIRTESGQTVTGVAHSGRWVEVRF